MIPSNQSKKRKASLSKKKMNVETEKPAGITFREIAFINRTEPPAKKATGELNALTEKLVQQLLETLIKQLEHFMETYGGYYTRSALMKMMDITSKNTFNTWMKEKGLPYYQVDTKILIKKSDLEEFLKNYRKVMPFLVFYLSALSGAGAWLMAT